MASGNIENQTPLNTSSPAPRNEEPIPRREIQKQDPILITGANGFIGRNLAARLGALGYKNLLCFDIDSPKNALEQYTQQAKFVYHLAGVNRPKDPAEFDTGNRGLTETLLQMLHRHANRAPVLLSSSAQAGNGSDYAKSKENAETALRRHGEENQSIVYPFRLPGVFGKWSRPNYNTVVATFCHHIARGEPVEIHDPAHTLTLCYIDDVIDTFLSVLSGTPHAPLSDGCYGISTTYTPTLGALADTIRGFAASRSTLAAPNVSSALSRKLYATYLTYLPEQDISYPLAMNTDERGSFTEFLRTEHAGQISVNVAKPGIVKGNHWHDTKNEKFLVVSGQAIIRLRMLGCHEISEIHVSDSALTVVDILPGCTHNIENTGKDNLVTLMWASEPFNPEHPDTFFEMV